MGPSIFPQISSPYSVLPSPPLLHTPSKRQIPTIRCSKSSSVITPPAITTFGFSNFMQTVTVDVSKAEGRPLNVPLIAPFTIANSRLDTLENVAIRVELVNGSVGWGEAPFFSQVASDDQKFALEKATEVCSFLKRCPAMSLSLALSEIGGILSGHQFASVRAGVEMALIDAAAKSVGVPLWRLFGGASNAISTDITIPIVSVDKASELALQYKKQGFKTLKLNIGANLKADIEILKVIREVYPECQFILDANQAYSPQEAVQVLEILHEMAVTPVLLEQPVHKDDWEGLGFVSQTARDIYGISVAADEICQNLSDAKKIIKEKLAGVINFKLAKLGVLGALEIIELVKDTSLDLMIGCGVETRLGIGFAGHLAAGMGCFKYVDLDTFLLLEKDPVCGGFEVSDATYKFTNARGHGGFLHWKNIECCIAACLTTV